MKEFDFLADLIADKASRRTIVYIPNPGNFGDGLIRYATKQFFADHEIEHRELNIGYVHIRYQLIPYLLKRHRYTFIYGGGGAWSKSYRFGHDICRFISSFTDELIVLPTTFGAPVKAVRGIQFRRDEFESKENNPDAPFCHDMAFYLCRGTWSDRFDASFATHNLGLFLRTDRESRFMEGNLPEYNRDLSDMGDHMANANELIREVARYRTVVTDRLHLGIAACIARRRLHLLAGNYFKIAAVHRSSIAPYFGDLATFHNRDVDFRQVIEQLTSAAAGTNPSYNHSCAR